MNRLASIGASTIIGFIVHVVGVGPCDAQDVHPLDAVRPASSNSLPTTKLQSFVVRRGAKLFEDDREFRFLSFNIPELVLREEPYWGLNHAFEQADALQTIRAFGGRATRCYVMSVSSPQHKGPRHIRAARQYDEQVFQSMDQTLAECHRAGVRLIVPFLDNWKWWGGIEEFAALRGKSVNEFYTDAQLKDDYKHLVSHVLRRINTVTHVAYRDDPAILAWETGNELRGAPVEWTLEMAKFIKSIDPHHLVVDGNDDTLDPRILASEDIDVVVKHYYRGTESSNGIVDYEKRLLADLAVVGDRKPLLIGEFGFAKTDEIMRFANAVVDSQAVGAMIWSLRQHDYQGGFRWHVEGQSGYAAYHWPGFASGNAYDEIRLLQGFHAAAQRIQGLDVTPPEIPATPTMLPVETVYDIRWRGSVGAASYDVQRSENGTDWTTIASDVSDSVNRPERIVFRRIVDVMDRRSRFARQHVFMQDVQAEIGTTYSYRVRARNGSGASPWSDAVEVAVTKQSGFEVVDLGSQPHSPTFQVESTGDVNSILLIADRSSANDAIEFSVSHDGMTFTTVAHTFVQEPDGGPSMFTVTKIAPRVRHFRLANHGNVKLIRLQYGFGAYHIQIPRP